MANRKVGQWLNMLACGLILLKTVDADVGITYVENAVAKGAVCLDGSPPAYNWDKGFGSGINNWLVHLQGGGWCQNVTSCLLRKNTDLGSSKQMQKQLFFPGILSNQQKLNPDFYNWNRIVVRYCDGASFTGDVEEVNPDTNLHFRGGRIFVAVIEELLAKGMKNAENAILTGCSSGGLATIFHCDGFRVLLPKGTEVKCVSDAGYFVNVKDITGVRYIEAYYNDLVTTHGSAKNLPKSCTTKLSPGLCFFPQNVAQLLETPLFILNAAYDSWQKKEFDVGHESRIAIVIILEMLRQLRCYVQSHCFFVSPCSLLLCHMDLGFGYKIPNVLVPRVADPYSLWSDCKLNTTSCSTDQLKIIEGFRLEFLHALEGPCRSSSRGLFINSCYVHCQSVTQETWLSNDSFVLGGKTIAEAVGDWYHNRCPCQKIDGSVSPFSETCHNSEETLYPI